MFSTHYKTPRRPDDRALRLLDLLARQTADIIEQGNLKANFGRPRPPPKPPTRPRASSWPTSATSSHAHERHPGHDRPGTAEGGRPDRPGLPANGQGIGRPALDASERPAGLRQDRVGETQLESAPFSLRRMLDQITRVLSVRASEKGLCFCCRVPNETPDAVVGDRCGCSKSC